MATTNNGAKAPANFGGRNPGSGRPQGSKNKFSRTSVATLEELDFCPIREAVALYRETQKKLYELEASSARLDEQTKLRNILARINSDLSAYGFSKLPSQTINQNEDTTRVPIAIKLDLG